MWCHGPSSRTSVIESIFNRHRSVRALKSPPASYIKTIFYDPLLLVFRLQYCNNAVYRIVFFSGFSSYRFAANDNNFFISRLTENKVPKWSVEDHVNLLTLLCTGTITTVLLQCLRTMPTIFFSSPEDGFFHHRERGSSNYWSDGK